MQPIQILFIEMDLPILTGVAPGNHRYSRLIIRYLYFKQF